MEQEDLGGPSRNPSQNDIKARVSSILDLLCTRFLLNCPKEELQSIERMLFIVEQMHWFYEDFFRDEDERLPSFSFQGFARRIFLHFPPLNMYANDVAELVAKFKRYKIRVPVCGGIVLNMSLTKCLLVRGYHTKAAWSFPKGKINKDEKMMTCAVREVLEETGFDGSGFVTEDDYVEFFNNKEQQIRLYIMPGVPEQTYFCPRTRKEIGAIEWHSISRLMKHKYDNDNGGKYKYYHVAPCMGQLAAWIKKNANNRRRLTRGTTKVATAKLQHSLSQTSLSHSGGGGSLRSSEDGGGQNHPGDGENVVSSSGVVDVNHLGERELDTKRNPIQKLLEDHPHLQALSVQPAGWPHPAPPGLQDNPMWNLFQQTQLLPHGVHSYSMHADRSGGVRVSGPQRHANLNVMDSEGHGSRTVEGSGNNTSPPLSSAPCDREFNGAPRLRLPPIPDSLKVSSKLTTGGVCLDAFLGIPATDVAPKRLPCGFPEFHFDADSIWAAMSEQE